jgi:RHS repeat-associated protein
VVQTRYLPGPGVNEWLAQINSGGDQWLLTDRLGPVRDVVVSAGTMVQDHTERQAFGGITSDTNAAAASRLGFQGTWQDPPINLVFDGRRAWNTWTMQWDQEDPTTPRQIDARDGNYRRLVGNDPTNATDPSGRDAADPNSYVVDPSLKNETASIIRFRLNAIWARMKLQGQQLTAGDVNTLIDLYIPRKDSPSQLAVSIRDRIKEMLRASPDALFYVFVSNYSALPTEQLSDADAKRIQQKLISDLDSEEFKVRDEAKKALIQIGTAGGPLLQQALKSGALSLEQEQTIKDVLGKIHYYELSDRDVFIVELAPEVTDDPCIAAMLAYIARSKPESDVSKAAQAALKKLLQGMQK